MFEEYEFKKWTTAREYVYLVLIIMVVLAAIGLIIDKYTTKASEVAKTANFNNNAIIRRHYASSGCSRCSASK